MLSSSLKKLEQIKKLISQKPLLESCLKEKDQRLNWFAGIIDGEGSFGIYPISNGDYQGKIQIQNTSLPMIRKIQEIVRDDLGVNLVRYRTYRKYFGKKKEKSSIYHAFSWQSYNDLSILLKATTDLLVAKQNEALLLSDWLEYRSTATNKDPKRDKIFEDGLKQLKVIPS